MYNQDMTIVSSSKPKNLLGSFLMYIYYKTNSLTLMKLSCIHKLLVSFVNYNTLEGL